MKQWFRSVIKALRRARKKLGAAFHTLGKRILSLDLTVRRILAASLLVLAAAILVWIVSGVVSCAGNCSTKQAEAGVQLSETPAPTGEDGQPLTETPTASLCPDDPTETADPSATYETGDATAIILQKHDQSEEVHQLQLRLMELGYLDLDEATDYFGSGTEYAVKLFQRQHALATDGIAGESTLVLLYSANAEKYCLKEGSEGKDVKLLQERLEELGYLSTSQVDSVYGAATIAAVENFQDRNSLHADGLAGEKTLELLYSDDARISYSLYKQQKEEAAAAAKATAKATEKTTTTTRIDRFISAAKSRIGCEYVLGDRGPDSFDCSGLVYYCLRKAGVSCSRLNAAGFSNKSTWKEITSVGSLQKGDILFFKSDDSSRVSHCGIYIGSGMMIDASSSNGKVVKRALSNYWKRNFVNARRPW